MATNEGSGGSDVNANFRRLMALLDSFDEIQVTVGLNVDEGQQRHENGTQLATAAFYNEFGTVHIPARPAYRQIANDQAVGELAFRKMVATLQVAHRNEALNDHTIENVMHRMGEDMGSELAQRIRDWAIPPNAEATIAKKGFNDPLFETGRTLESLSALTTRRNNRVKKTMVRPK